MYQFSISGRGPFIFNKGCDIWLLSWENVFWNQLLGWFGLSAKKTNELKTNSAYNFVESVPEYELPYLFKHFNCGIVSLNKKLITNNIPGKFVSYVQFGLPILSFCNKKSKLATLVNEYKCGIVIDYEDDLKINLKKINSFCKNIKLKNNKYSINSKRLFLDYFDINKVKNRIIKIIWDLNELYF